MARVTLRVFAGFWLVTLVSPCGPLPARADETAGGGLDRAASLERLTRAVQEYTFRAGNDGEERLDFVQSPILRYSDPITSIDDGAVFVWTREGRPEAAMAVHIGTAGRPWLEFRSLSSGPLAATRMGRPEWFPKEPGLEFKPLEGAPPPGKTAPLRMTQMRSMLRPFTASISDNQGGRQELRLLSQPVFRYSQPDRGIIDGALFLFVRATNPEPQRVRQRRATRPSSHRQRHERQRQAKQGVLQTDNEQPAHDL